ncbi:MAG: DHH family phosphoesterase [Methanomassiliicoccaceae archaeon]|jgi:RecJ-like exonuclease|nr:DHH family phosphoesterase [Methanomassiliicoccaceae archaeon]
MDDLVLKLFSHLSYSADAIVPHDHVHIFSHHDADGISAAIILAKTMMRCGKSFTVSLLSTLNDETIKEIETCGSKCIIIADMGASYIGRLDRMNADIIVLDHHKGSEEPKRIHYTNPHSFGIDGQDGGCGASVSFLFAIAVNERNWDLVQVAFAGIVGDKQHLKGFTGINEYLFAEGRRKGFIATKEGSLIPEGELVSSLYRSTEPYIRGVSGNAEGVAALLRDASVASTRSADLNDAERRKLSSLIAAKLLKQNVSKDVMEELCIPSYALKDWEMDAASFASLLNSCGKSGAGGVAVGLGLGDKKCLSDAIVKDNEMRNMIVNALTEMDKRGIEERTNIRCFENASSGFTGTLCEILMRFTGDGRRPTVGYSVSDNITKASARCTHAILNKGVDLSFAMRKAGELAGGGGGGHKIASGAWFPPGNEKLFLEALDRIIGEQFSATSR